MAETKRAEYKFCPKCWDKEPTHSETPPDVYCTSCGTKMVDWTLTCECGHIIRPSFWSIFLGFTVPYQKHCPNCGRPTAKLAKREAKRLQKEFKRKD